MQLKYTQNLPKLLTILTFNHFYTLLFTSKLNQWRYPAFFQNNEKFKEKLKYVKISRLPNLKEPHRLEQVLFIIDLKLLYKR